MWMKGELIMLELKIKCPDCGSEDTRSLGALEIRNTFANIKVEPLESSLYVCDHCSLGFRAPRWSPDKILNLYAEAEINVWKQNLPTAPWKTIYTVIEKIAPKSVLDFGCFAGDFLRFLPIQCEKFGVEPSLEARNEATKHGIHVLGKMATDLPADIFFDVITILDVIEHVEQPSALMHSLAAHLNPGGKLIILTGAFDSVWFRIFAPRFWYCTISEHLVFISKKWCARFASKNNLQLINYDLIACEPKPVLKKFLEITRAFVFKFIVPVLIRVPQAAKILGMRRLLLWKFAPNTSANKDHVIAIFSKN